MAGGPPAGGTADSSGTGPPAETRAHQPGGLRRDRLATGVRFAAHVYALGPLAIAVFVTLAGRLTANPIEDLTRRLGQDALLMLTLSLAVSPVVWVLRSGWRPSVGTTGESAAGRDGGADRPSFRLRLATALRPLGRIFGLYAFAYACLHLFLFAVVDYGLVPGRLMEAVFEKRYAVVGLVAFVLLALLAGTSTAGRRRRIGAAWVPLQRLVYPAALLVVLHMLLAAKVVTSARIAWALVVVVLLLLRIPMWWLSRRLQDGKAAGGGVGVASATPVGRAG